MFIRLAIWLAAVSPALRRRLWRWWYDRLARHPAKDDWVFMNYGWQPASGPRLPLDAADEPDRFCIQLYERVVAAAPLGGVRVLEVGAGRGGGASYVARYHRPAHVVAVDYSGPAVEFCRRRHASVGNLEFVRGDAEALPFPDASFDAVVNVESSHCYGDLGRFFNEAARVLRPGGFFLFADLRTPRDTPLLAEKLAAETRWCELAHEDLTGGVVAALSADHARKAALIAKNFPEKMRPIFGEFAALEATPIFAQLSARELLYHRFVFQKR